MVELGKMSAQEHSTATVVSGRSGVPKAFLHKISAYLQKASPVKTFAGSQGGMSFAKPADQITMQHTLYYLIVNPKGW